MAHSRLLVCLPRPATPPAAPAWIAYLAPPPPEPLQVFYYIVMALFGTMKGIVQLNLGAISTFQVGPRGRAGAGGL